MLADAAADDGKISPASWDKGNAPRFGFAYPAANPDPDGDGPDEKLKFGLEAWSVVLTCIWRILPEAGSMHSVEAAIAVWVFYTYRATLHLWIGGMPRIKKCPWRLGL